MENKIIITKYSNGCFSTIGGMEVDNAEREQLLQEVLMDIIKSIVSCQTNKDEKNKLLADFILKLKDEIVWG